MFRWNATRVRAKPVDSLSIFNALDNNDTQVSHCDSSCKSVRTGSVRLYTVHRLEQAPD
jgi:hypothetical protein